MESFLPDDIDNFSICCKQLLRRSGNEFPKAQGTEVAI